MIIQIKLGVEYVIHGPRQITFKSTALMHFLLLQTDDAPSIETELNVSNINSYLIQIFKKY